MITIYNYEINKSLAMLLYWIPLAVCSFGYLIRTFKNYLKDKNRRDGNDDNTYYTPTETLGDLIGRGLISIIPIANILAAIFDVMPEILSKLFHWIGEKFNKPLVPDNDAAKQKRQEIQAEKYKSQN